MLIIRSPSQTLFDPNRSSDIFLVSNIYAPPAPPRSPQLSAVLLASRSGFHPLLPHSLLLTFSWFPLLYSKLIFPFKNTLGIGALSRRLIAAGRENDLMEVYREFGLHRMTPSSLVPENTCGDEAFEYDRLFNASLKDSPHPAR